MIKADLHIHSNHSDRKCSVGENLKSAIAKRLDAISITDNTLNSSLKVVEIVRKGEFASEPPRP